jgi:hypothetical protein
VLGEPLDELVDSGALEHEDIVLHGVDGDGDGEARAVHGLKGRVYQCLIQVQRQTLLLFAQSARDGQLQRVQRPAWACVWECWIECSYGTNLGILDCFLVPGMRKPVF